MCYFYSWYIYKRKRWRIIIKFKRKNKKYNNIDKVLSRFKCIKSLDENISKDIYENIIVLQNSKYKIELIKREFKVYKDDDRKEEIKTFKRGNGKEGKEDKKQNTTKVLDE